MEIKHQRRCKELQQEPCMLSFRDGEGEIYCLFCFEHYDWKDVQEDTK